MTHPRSAMFTDLYELTMLYGYWRAGLHRRPAVFDLFHRRSPFGGAYAVSAGLEDALRFLAEAHFSDDDLQYLSGLGMFSTEFLDRLRRWRFSGDVLAMAEGTPAFPFEPMWRVTAALEEAQLVESALLNIVNFQSLIATKAARICREAGADNVMEFGMRGAQGVDGAMSAARACYIGGCVATSNVEAAQHLGIRPSGTMAHSWVMAFSNELEAFRRYAEAYPERGILLIDTYDTLRQGAPNAALVGRELAKRGGALFAVRLDSGDLARLAAGVRRILDRAGLTSTRIVGSGDLDEFAIRELKRRGAPIDFFGVGRRMVAAHGDESFTGVYKLAAIADRRGRWRAVRKLTDDRRKATLPGVKQAWRLFDRRGAAIADWLDFDGPDPMRETAFAGRALHNGRLRKFGSNIDCVAPLLQPVMRGGAIVAELPALGDIRARVRESLDALPEARRRLDNPEPHPVVVGPALARALNER